MMLKVATKVNRVLVVATRPFVAAPARIAPLVPAQQRSVFLCRAYDNYRDDSRASSGSRYSVTELQVGQEIQGTVKTIVAFGAFIDVGATTDGLVHISQLTEGFVKDVSDVVSVGDPVSVRVLSIEGDKRLALTMKSGDSEDRRSSRGGYSDRGDSRERW